MKGKSFFRQIIIQWTCQKFTKTQPHKIFLSILLTIRFLQFAMLNISCKEIIYTKNIMPSQKLVEGISIILLVFQVVLIGIITWSFNRIKNNNNKYSKKEVIEIKYDQKTIQKIIFYSLIICRIILLIPIVCLYLYTLESNSSNDQQKSSIYSTLNFILYFGIIFPFSALDFFNQISTRDEVLSYLYAFNAESFTFIYSPLQVIVLYKKAEASVYFDIIFILLYLFLIYVRPVLTYKSNKLSTIGVSSIVSSLIVSSIAKISQVKILTFGGFILFVFCLFSFGSLLHIIQQNSMKRILNINRKQQSNFLNSFSYNEILMFFIANYKEYKNEIKLFFLKSLQNIEGKIENNQSCKSNEIGSGEQKQNQKNKQSHHSKQYLKIKNQLLSEFGKQNRCQQKIQSLFYQLFINEFYQKYNPIRLKKQNLGKNALLKIINNQSNVLIFLLQTLILSQKSFMKSYFLIKCHNQLIKSIPTQNIFSQINCRCIQSIIEQQLLLKSKVSPKYNLKAKLFFQFQQEQQKLRKQILKSCQNKIQFWSQTLHSQPHQSKIKDLIQENHYLQKKILQRCTRILKNYEESPFILFNFISPYSQYVLNCKVNYSLSLFNFVAKSVSKRFQLMKGHLNINMQTSNIFTNYPLQRMTGVFLIDLEDSNYHIQWANSYFWRQIYSFSASQYFQQKQSKEIRKISMLSLILPQLRKPHTLRIQQFINQSSQLNYFHSQEAIIYNEKNKTFQKAKLQFQIIPSLMNGFKMAGFVHKRQNDFAQKSIQIILDKNLNLVACSQYFQNEIKQFFTPQKRQKIESSEQCIQQLLQNTNFYNFCTKIIQLDKLELEDNKKPQEILKLQNSDYKVTLIKIIQSKRLFQNSDIISSVLYNIQFINILTQGNLEGPIFKDEMLQKKSKLTQQKVQIYSKRTPKQTLNFNKQTKQFQNQLWKNLTREISISNFAYTRQTQQTNNINNILTANNTFTSTNQNIDQIKNNYLDLVDCIIIKQAQKVEDKSDQINKIQKNYLTILKTRIPHKIHCWKGFICFLAVLLLVLMILNIVIFLNRKNIYKQKQQTIYYFGQLITDVAQAVTALRQYNYYASVYSPERPQIPVLVQKLKTQQHQINTALKALTTELIQEWSAYNILESGQTLRVNDTSYVVLSNYMLSAINYITQVNSSQLTYPILVTLLYYYELSPSTVQLRLLEAIYNGLYVGLAQLGDIQNQMLGHVEFSLKQYSQLYFVYTSVCGFICILIFITYSLTIQIHSERIRQQTSKLLSPYLLSKKLRLQKVQKLKYFKQNFNSDTQQQRKRKSQKNQALDFLTQTFSNIQKLNTQKIPQMSRFGKQLNLNNILYDQTNRQLNGSQQLSSEENNSVLAQNLKESSHNFKINPNNQITVYSEKLKNLKIYSFSTSQRLFKIGFYLLICVPSIAYFVTILIGGVYYNNTIIDHLRFNSQLHNRRSNQQIVYLYTRQTPYYEQFMVEIVPDWYALSVETIQSTYQNDRLVQKHLLTLKESSHVLSVLNKIQNEDLCENLHEFNHSQYYNISFSKEECLTFDQKLMTRGFKQMIVSFLQTAIYLVNIYPVPQNMTYPQRFEFLQKSQLQKMKIMLVYAEQFMQQLIDASQKDINEQIDWYISMVILFTCVSASGLSIIFITINSRWKRILKQRKQIQSVISLISLKTLLMSCSNENKINLNSSKAYQGVNKQKERYDISQEFLKINWNFYK